MAIHGRDREMGVLDDLIVRARTGRGGALALRAGPGLGRSALLHWTARRATGFRVLSVRGVAAETALPYAALGRLLPAVPASLTDLHDQLAEAARTRPVLCVIDDTSQLDAPSLAALAYAARRSAGQRLVVLFGAPDEPDALTELPELPLGPLDAQASHRVLAGIADGIPDDLSAALVDLACGVPRALVDLGGALTPGQLSGREPPPVTLPEHSLLRSFYRGRLRRLTPDARLLLLLAVAEPRLDTATLTRAAARRGLDLGALEHARALGLVALDGPRVTIPTPLIRAILTAETTLADRTAAHTLLADLLDRDDQHLRRLRHRAAAEGPPVAPAEVRTAAAAASDPLEAADAWEWAAALSGATADLPSAAAAAWYGGATDRARSLAQRGLAAQPPPGGIEPPPGGTELLLGAIELCDGLPGRAAELFGRAAAALPEGERLRALALAGEARCLAGDVRGYVGLARQAAGLPGPELYSLHFKGHAAAYRNREFGDALRRVVELSESDPWWGCLAASLLGADGDLHRLASSVRGRMGRPAALLQLALAELWTGRFAEAVAACTEGVTAARAAGQRNVEAEHLAVLALIAALRGDRENALHRAGLAAPVIAGHGLSRPEAYLSWAYAALDLLADRPAEAVARLGTVTVHPVILVASTPLLVEAAVQSKGQRAAGRALGVFDTWAHTTGNPLRLALARRCHALLAERDAENHFEVALELHRGGSAFELARTEFLYGRWLRRARRPGDARDHLRHALYLFQHYEAGPWADKARAELRAAGEGCGTAAAPATSAELTAQQAQIARLAADGATNREIAAHLVLSHRTVEHHLRNVFARLGVRSRVELARHFR
ncbi:helix-turn-helix transcriptional regulator [Actinocorallia longicatena]|uniref:Helix-turn-helix transcriptional regulator n=1 Tax=Actinocorallia longicatena TaxID=111803 RepID=A0ABP6QJ07_9ACTN